MFVVTLADIPIGIDNRFSFVERQCRGFMTPDRTPAFTVSVTGDEIAEEKKNGSFSDGYCESICVYRKICETIPDQNVFLMHASVIGVDGFGYAFAAPSGTGKSTHTALWLKNIPGARVINGDKPLCRVCGDGRVTVYGTPWNGKENWGGNQSAELAGICFLERGAENAIRPASEDEAVSRMLRQLLLRGSRESVDRQLILMDALMRAVPFYVLACNISDEAALLSYRTMKKN